MRATLSFLDAALNSILAVELNIAFVLQHLSYTQKLVTTINVTSYNCCY